MHSPIPHPEKCTWSPCSILKNPMNGRRNSCPSQGCWLGDISLRGHTVKGSFEVFPSGGGWSLLFGKPLLKAFKAVHDYKDNTLKIPLNRGWSTIINVCTDANFVGESVNILQGDDSSPSRQVAASIINNIECVDKQTQLESFVNTAINNSNNE